MIEEEEIWRDVIGFERRYQISNFGNVKTLTREVKEKYRSYIRRGKILNKYHDNKGYYKVKLYNGDASFVSYPVHRLVAIHFIPNPNNYPQINHIDGHPGNNYEKNLEWCTNSQNTTHAYRTGLKNPDNYKGESCAFSKLTESQVLAIRQEYKLYKPFQRELAKKYNTAITNINMIINRKTWQHV
jgi:hypothetical protein